MNRDTTPADVDGDRSDDLAYHDWIRNRPVLGVCTAAGETDKIRGEAQAEVLEIIDVEADERDEIFFGGTTVGGRIAAIASFVDGDLQRIVASDGEPFLVVEGLDPGLLSDTQPAGAAFGCEDRNDDAQPELVQVSVRPQSKRQFRWTRTAYVIEGARAFSIDEETGNVPNKRKQDDHQEVVEIARSFTRDCPGESNA